MSEKLVWSKVRTNSFDSASSALILVNDDEAKIVKANRKKQIETLIAIAEFSVCVCLCWKSVRDLGFFKAAQLKSRERARQTWEVPRTWEIFFFFFLLALSSGDESTRSKCGRLSTWMVFIGPSLSHVCYLGKCRFEIGRVQNVCLYFRVLKGVLRLSKLDQLDFATSDKCDFLRRGCVSICPLLRRLWFSCSCVQNFSVFDLFFG